MIKKLTLSLGFCASFFVTGTVCAQIEEITVTARKREENLQDVPIVVTAFTAAAIERKGIADLSDVAKYTSGLFLDEGFSKQDTRIVLRGLSPTRGRQNVAILQDEVDISSLAQTTAGGSFVINPRLMDIERIEVVKGPHAALYGRSAFAGAINYITKKPGNEFEANVQADFGNYSKQEGRLSVSGPVIADKFSVGVNAEAWNSGGFYKSAVSGAGLGGGNGGGSAGNAVLTPSDDLKFTARIEYSKDNFTPEARTVLDPGLVRLPAVALQPANGLPAVVGTAIAAIPANSFFTQNSGSLGYASAFPAPAPSLNPRTGKDYPGSSRTLLRNTLRVDLNTQWADFTSITHYGDNKEFQFNDALQVGDLTKISGAQETYFDTKIKLATQEVRAQSNSKGRFNWTVGGLYWYERLEQNERKLICVGPTGGCASVFSAIGDRFATLPSIVKRNTRHLSAFGSAEYEIFTDLKVEGEVRYTSEKERTSGFPQIKDNLGCPAVTTTGRTQQANGTITCVTPGPLVTAFANVNNQYNYVIVPSNYWAPRFTIDYKLMSEALVYSSVGLGKKPGGNSSLTGLVAAPNLPGQQFTLDSISNANRYDSESMWVYEIGAKTNWFDNKLQVNGAIYYQDYSKKQVSITVVDAVTQQLLQKTVNAAKASVKGFEIDINAAPTRYLSFNVGYTYNDGKYDNFTDLQNGVSAISRAAINNPNACTVVVVGTPAQNRCAISYSGNMLEGAPKHSLQLGGEVRGDISANLGWFVDTDIRYTSKRYTSFENYLYMEPYWTADLRAGLKSEKWTITAYVNNLLDDDTMKASAVSTQNWSLAYLTNTGRTPLATQTPSGASALLPDKRQLGIRGSYNF